MGKPLVSVVITTKNSGRTLRLLLASIRKQSYKPVEVIVVDNASTDNTKGIATTFGSKVYNKGPERSAQRNFGAKKARGKYLLILDSDMVLTKRVVEQCVERLETLNSKFEIGGVIIPEKSYGLGFWAKVKAFEREINEGEDYLEAARFFPKQIFWEAGGYDENLTGPEDWDLPRRIAKKYKLLRIKNYILHNEGKTELLNLANKKFYYGLSAHRYLKKHRISVFSPTTVYFLRPSLYRNWHRLVTNPILALGLFVMLTFEAVGGGLGYFVGRTRK